MFVEECCSKGVLDMRDTARFVLVATLCCALSILGLSVERAPANAGEGGTWTWHPTGAFSIQCIIVDPNTPTTLYVGTETGGVFRSRDSGITWTSVGLAARGGKVNQLALSPVDTTVLYAACNDGLFRSKNSGNTWSKVDTLIYGGVWSVAVNPRQPSNLLADVNGSGLFRSADAGMSWTYVGYDRLLDWGPWCPVFSPTAASVVYGLYPGGLSRSTDGGATWSKASGRISSGATIARTGSLVLSPNSPTTSYVVAGGGVFHSTDSGASWVLGDAGLGNGRAMCVAIDPTTPTTLYAGTDRGVYRSTDGGKSWPTVTLVGEAVSALAIDPKDPSTIYAGVYSGQDGVFRSTDGGTTWMSLGLDGAGLDIVATCRDDPTVIYGAGDNGKVLRINDNGATFSSPSARLAPSGVTCLAVDPTTSSRVFAGTGADGIFRSVDGGRTWSSASTGLTDRHISCVAVDPRTPSVLYAGTFWRGMGVGHGAFRSTDGGGSWTEMTSGFKDRAILAIGIDPVSPTTLFVSTRSGGVFRSRNGGDTWTAASAGLEGARITGFAFDSSSPSNVFGVGSKKAVYRSINGGENWTSASMGIPLDSVLLNSDAQMEAIVVDPKTPTTVYVADDSVGVFRSTDSGATWSAVNQGRDAGLMPGAESLAISLSSLYTGAPMGLYSFDAVAFTLASGTSSASGGYVSRSPDLLTYAPGTLVTLTATPSAGYTFAGWSGNLTGATNPTTITMDGNKSITAAFAAIPLHVEHSVLVLHIGKSVFTVNGASKTLDSPPVIKNGRTLVPIRAIIEALGGTVDWDGAARKATVILEDTSLELWIGKSSATVNGITMPIDSSNAKVVAEIINGRTMLPLRFVTESLGATVSWEQSTQTITITYQP